MEILNLNIKEKFLNLLEQYTFSYIDDILKSYEFIKNEKDEYRFITNQITRILLKHNLEAIYTSSEPKKYEFTLNVGDKADDEFAKYNEKAGNPLEERLWRLDFKLVLKQYIVEDFLQFYSEISFNKRIYDLLNHINCEYVKSFVTLFELLQNMKLSGQDFFDITLYIMTINIDNGILNASYQDYINEAHRLIKDGYYDCIKNNTKIQIDSIIKAFELLNYPNIEKAKFILNKRINKKEKIVQKPAIIEPAVVQKKGIIAKSTYYEGCKIIGQYYNIDEDLVIRELSVNEIVYVTEIMQSLNFEEETIYKFLRSAYKMHKTLNPVDRYLDLSSKIEYFKEVADISSLDKTLRQFLHEYTIATDPSDKEFWLNSLDEELRKLEGIINNDYSYELNRNKSQD